ncbi:MAG TPA: hypothetical protein VNR42_01010 [Solirubrobacteraceae bacterium]|nr:hypothetical protein [Solirubrobacteraceae bacterium]
MVAFLSRKRKRARRAKTDGPTSVRVLAVLTFFGLLIVGLLSIVWGAFHNWIPRHGLGRLPLGIIWFAAIGGSLASLTGIFLHHKKDWEDSYNLWHMLRPWTGIVMGVLGAFFLLVSTEVATTTPNGFVASTKPVNADVYYTAAFIAGFAEQSFRRLVQRLTHAIFGPDENPRCCASQADQGKGPKPSG